MKRLGKRLAADEPAPGDTDLLEQVISHYTAVAITAEERVRDAFARTRPELDARVVSRGKTTETLVQKLQRQRELQLSKMQDLAGVRLVANMDLGIQDEAVDLVASLFDGPVKIVDRRAAPKQGYRAVHVHASIDGAAVEIQVRTALQSRWAEIFESVADVWGRQIRYGEPPDSSCSGQLAERNAFITDLIQAAETVKQWERLRVDVLRGRRERLAADLRRKSKGRTRQSLEEMTELRVFMAEHDRGQRATEQAADRGQALLKAQLEALAAAASKTAEFAGAPA